MSFGNLTRLFGNLELKTHKEGKVNKHTQDSKETSLSKRQSRRPGTGAAFTAPVKKRELSSRLYGNRAATPLILPREMGLIPSSRSLPDPVTAVLKGESRDPWESSRLF